MENAIDLEKIDDSNHLLDILINCEAVLDSLDCYTAANWIEGVVVQGPLVRRYRVTIGLLYPHNKMPDPTMALRLLKVGIQVEFDRMQRAKPAVQPGQEPAEEKPAEWLIRLSIPRRLLDANKEADLEVYDDEIDTDEVTDAMDGGLDDESSLHADEQQPGGEQMPPDPAQMEPPPGGSQKPPA